MSANTHWAHLNEAGASWGLRLLVLAYRIGGKPLFQVLLAPVLLYFYLVREQSRAASRDYLTTLRTAGALPNHIPLWLQSYKHFWQFGNCLIDKLAVWQGKIGLQDVTLHEDQVIYDQLSRGEGAILLMSHLGNFEVCRCLSARHSNLKLTVLMHTKHAARFNEVLKSVAHDDHIEILQVTEITPATAMMLNERVERGEFIAIAGDRVAINNPDNCLWVNFFGRVAPLPAGPFTLAAILRAPLISLFCMEQRGGYHITFERISPPLKLKRRERAAGLNRIAQQYAERLEYYCRQYPMQWYNFFNFWSLPEPPAGQSPTEQDS